MAVLYIDPQRIQLQDGEKLYISPCSCRVHTNEKILSLGSQGTKLFPTPDRQIIRSVGQNVQVDLYRDYIIIIIIIAGFTVTTIATFA